MKIDDLASKHDQAKIFSLEYEFRIHRLKLDYITLADVRPAGSDLEQLAAEHQAGIAALRSFVAGNFTYFNAASCSSLSCIPTRALGDDERYLHRIWMGGPLPAIACEAIGQWGAALDEVRYNGGAPYVSILWVWDAQQLRHDARFSPTGGAGRYTIGRYAIGGTTLHINSLRALALDFAPARFDILDTLHAQRYFATLSDYFRILIMCEYGGMYMDVGQGLFRQMFHEIRDLASRKGCARITLTVWEKSEALQVYLHKGFRSVGTFDYAYSLFYDRLHFLVYEGD